MNACWGLGFIEIQLYLVEQRSMHFDVPKRDHSHNTRKYNDVRPKWSIMHSAGRTCTSSLAVVFWIRDRNLLLTWITWECVCFGTQHGARYVHRLTAKRHWSWILKMMIVTIGRWRRANPRKGLIMAKMMLNIHGGFTCTNNIVFDDIVKCW